MIVLGKTNDDRGTQLETLTADLLERLGFGEIHTNIVGSGGSEVDVTAQYHVPFPGGSSSSIEVVGECKALKDKLTMADFQRLLGKLHLAQARTPHVMGLLVALNGFNGNVLGAYRDYNKLKTGEVMLIGPDKIEEAVLDLYKPRPRQAVFEILRRHILVTPLKLELVYYARDVVWLAEFADGRFALLAKDGSPMSTTSAGEVAAMVAVDTGGGELMDLAAEQQATLRRLLSAKVQVAALLIVGGEATQDELMVDEDYTGEEHQAGLALLVEQSLVQVDGQRIRLSFLKSVDRAGDFARIALFWFSGAVPLAYVPLMLASDLYRSSVDNDLCEHVGRLQGNIPIPAERLSEMRRLLRLSPSALAFALTPQDFFLQHRVVHPVPGEALDRDDLISLFNNLNNLLLRDFHNPTLSAFYYEDEGVREVESREHMQVKGRQGPLFETDSYSRSAIAPLDESVGGTFALVFALDGAPEPWEDPSPYDSFPENYERVTGNKACLYAGCKTPGRAPGDRRCLVAPEEHNEEPAKGPATEALEAAGPDKDASIGGVN